MSYISLGNAFYAHSNLCGRDSMMNHRENIKINENNNELSMNGNEKLQEIWSAHTFEPSKNDYEVKLDDLRMSWINEASESRKQETKEEKVSEEKELVENEDVPSSPSHHARRPMNAFLIFCKKHRPIVRDRFPTLENRGVTKILGEWWSLLDEPDKMPFTNLANEYKDAFLSANPHFKWYKLPAPPLRTLNLKTSHTVQKLPTPLSNQSSQLIASSNEFTPGKLADESQLGSLTSLLNNNFNYVCSADKCPESKESNNNVENLDSDMKTPVNLETPNGNNLPPKPIKKRIFEQYFDNSEPSRMVPEETSPNESKFDYSDGSDGGRKPGRQCKGKRYEKFMVEGKLLGNKKDTKLTQNKPVEKSYRFDIETPKLESTIKRLAERTKGIFDSSPGKEIDDAYSSNFDLHERISNLPSLSYDAFVQKKRDSKKRKFRINTSDKHSLKQSKIELVGAKKRKNKNNITHLEKLDTPVAEKQEMGYDDLLGLATLAEVASNTQKINEI